jgi:hypothetical protein
MVTVIMILNGSVVLSMLFPARSENQPVDSSYRCLTGHSPTEKVFFLNDTVSM